MTDTDRSPAPSPARNSASAMDQALDWLIVMGSASEEQARQFQQWLDADPSHAEAFARAQAIWD
ncbi:FecR/PupR family sigma factor regulator, partial [Pseudomonas fluorescens]